MRLCNSFIKTERAAFHVFRFSFIHDCKHPISSSNFFFVYDNENEDRDLCRPIREGEVVPIELHY